MRAFVARAQRLGLQVRGYSSTVMITPPTTKALGLIAIEELGVRVEELLGPLHTEAGIVPGSAPDFTLASRRQLRPHQDDCTVAVRLDLARVGSEIEGLREPWVACRIDAVLPWPR